MAKNEVKPQCFEMQLFLYQNKTKIVAFVIAAGALMLYISQRTTSKQNSMDTSETLDSLVPKGGLHDENVLADDKRLSQKSLDSTGSLPIVITFTNAESNGNLKLRLRKCIDSIMKHSSVNLTFNFMGDEPSSKFAKAVVAEFNQKHPHIKTQVATFAINDIATKIGRLLEKMQARFSYKKGAYYNDPLFFLSPTLYQVLPYKRVIMLDSDLVFRSDIRHLAAIFDNFSASNVLGIAHDQQPVYRHTFSSYRSRHPGTRVGDPPPRGLSGFNSGVLLLDLERMRSSSLYQSLLDPAAVEAICDKYMFQGHLGDQDFYSVLEMEHQDLFHVLPCSWNRQLCTWWRDHGYEHVFDQYHACPAEKIHVWHGNCNTPIPDESDEVFGD